MNARNGSTFNAAAVWDAAIPRLFPDQDVTWRGNAGEQTALVRCVLGCGHKNGDAHPSLTLFRDGGFLCQAFGAKGSLKQLVIRQLGEAAWKELGRLGAGMGGRRPKRTVEDLPGEWAKLFPEAVWTDRFHLDYDLAQRYLRSGPRDGIRVDTHIAIYDQAGKLTGIKSRHPGGGVLWPHAKPGQEDAKYRCFEGSSIKHVLFLLDRAQQHPQATVVVVAGEKDALVAASHLDPQRWAPVSGCIGEGGVPSGIGHMLAGRRVVIAYDPDPTGRAGAAKVAKALKGKAAEVLVATMPDGEGPRGEGKWDVAAVVLADGAERLERILEAAMPASSATPPREPGADEDQDPPAAPGGASAAPPPATGPYIERDGRTYWRKPSGEGVQEVQLADFAARIVAEVLEDDGLEQGMRFELEARGRRFELTPAAFRGMTWPLEQIGASARISPGVPNVERRLVDAIQALSGDVPRRTLFTHLGWTKLPRHGWVYLHAGGAIGAEGAIADVGVRLRDPHDRFLLPAPPTGPELRAAVRASLQVLDVAPRRITVPLLAAVYRAPLGRCDFSMFLSGTTGSQKSCLAALAQQHYGPSMTMTRGRPAALPSGWAGSSGSLELLTFRAKDALFVVDDFVAKAGAREREKLQAAAELLFRGAANGTGRTRLTAEAEAKAARVPRGLTLATGEDLPILPSLVARLLVLDVPKGVVDKARLTSAQVDADAGVFAAAMSAYLRWLAPRREADAKGLSGAVVAESTFAVGDHDRAVGAGGSLMVGLRSFAAFAREVGALSSAEVEQLVAEGRAALGEALRGQAGEQRSVDPVRRFVEGLQAAIGSGAAHVAWSDGEQPRETPRAWGWKTNRDGRQDDENDENRARSLQWLPRGECVGWLLEAETGLELYLSPDSALKAARDALAEGLELSSRELAKMLVERELLLSTAGSRQTLRVRPPKELLRAGAPSGCLRVRASLVAPDAAPDVGSDPTRVGSSWPKPTDPTLFAAGGSGGDVGMSGLYTPGGGTPTTSGDPT